MTRIKVCGNTRPEDVTLALELGVDLLGFIFTRSPRQVTIDQAQRLVEGVPDDVERVGVFIDEPTTVIERAVESCRLSTVQIYRALTSADRRLGVRILPALRIRPDEAIDNDGFEPTDRPLLDSWSSRMDGGGTGQTWEWQRAEDLARHYPVIISGGLNAANVAEAITRLKPWGVDVCSGVEEAPRRKDPARLRAFVQAVRRADDG